MDGSEPYFVRSGGVRPNYPDYNNAGATGYDWSSTPNSNGTNAYVLTIYPASNGNVNPSFSSYRYDGRSLRCLARP